jgi:lysozyme
VTDTPLELYHRFVAAQPADARDDLERLPVVVMLGERVRGGQSALVEAGLRWRETAQKLRPSLSDADALVRFYQGDTLVAIELAIALVDDEAAPARDGLSALFAELRGRDVSAIVVVEYDTLDPGAIDALVARAGRIGAKLALLARAIDGSLDARLCLVAPDAGTGGDGFDDLVRVLAGAGQRLALDVASGALTVAAITAAFADVLPYGLTRLDAAGFARLAGFLAHVEGFATALAAFVAAFAAQPGPAPAARLTTLCLFVSDGTFAGTPFPVLDPRKLRPAPPLAWRQVVPRCLAIAAAASLPATLGPLLASLISAGGGGAPVRDGGVPDAGAGDGGVVVGDGGAPGDAGSPGDGGPPDDGGAVPGDAGGGDLAICPPSPPSIDIKLYASTTRAVGIDISSYDQAPLPWAALKRAGVTFVYIKASEGLATDSAFAAHWRDAKACGLRRGAYHLVHFNDDPGAQAAAFVAKVGADRGELPPVIDVETSAVDEAEARPGTTCASMQAALAALTNQITSYTGSIPAIYTSNEAWSLLSTCGDTLAAHPLWLKHYAPEYEIRLFGGWKQWTFWQTTGSGTITGERPGYVHKIDVDQYHGTPDELHADFPIRGTR